MLACMRVYVRFGPAPPGFCLTDGSLRVLPLDLRHVETTVNSFLAIMKEFNGVNGGLRHNSNVSDVDVSTDGDNDERQ